MELIAVQTTSCRFYSWFDGERSLMSNSRFPAYKVGSFSGTILGPCRHRGIDELGFRYCQEVDFEDSHIYIYIAGLIDIKNGWMP